jgi:hypothetical protein
MHDILIVRTVKQILSSFSNASRRRSQLKVVAQSRGARRPQIRSWASVYGISSISTGCEPLIFVVCCRCRNNPVKNPYTILRQKEQDIARVRKEIQALLVVIPLLADADLSWDELKVQLVESSQRLPASATNGMAELELYFPFVKNLQLDDSTSV